MAWYGTVSDIRHRKAAAIVLIALESVKSRFCAFSGVGIATSCT